MFVSIGSPFRKGNEKVCEEIDICIFGNPTKPTASEPKEKNFIKSKHYEKSHVSKPHYPATKT
jgi:hypothetical protein